MLQINKQKQENTVSEKQTYVFRNSEEQTTETDDIAIAKAAIHGCNTKWIGKNIPAATGIPIKLYTRAKIKLIFILLTVFRERSIAATTSIRSF